MLKKPALALGLLLLLLLVFVLFRPGSGAGTPHVAAARLDTGFSPPENISGIPPDPGVVYGDTQRVRLIRAGDNYLHVTWMERYHNEAYGAGPAYSRGALAGETWAVSLVRMGEHQVRSYVFTVDVAPTRPGAHAGIVPGYY